MPVLYKPGTAPVPVPADLFPAKRLLWTSAAGVTLDLSDRDNGYACMPGRAGFGPVDAQVVADTMWDGSTLVRTHRPTPRTLTVPLLVISDDDSGTYLARWRALQAAFRHPLDSDTGLPRPGRLTVQLVDSSSRSIPAYYSAGGAPTEDTLDDVGAGWCMLPNLQFYAAVATWEGDPVTQTWVLPGSSGGVPPLPPVTLTTASVLGSSVLTNPGDADAYPVWAITGPGTPTILNSDTGESVELDTAIGAGVTVTVDCRPPALAPATGLTATDNLGNDWWPHLVNYPAFWPLPPGDTNITLTLAGATSASSVELTPATASRWQGGW